MNSNGKESGAAISDVLSRVLRAKGLDEGVRRAAVLLDWDRCVGERIAEVSQATGVEGGTVYVEVRSSVWLQELTFMRKEILEKLNAESSHTRFDRIMFRLAGAPKPTPERTRAKERE